MVNRLAPSMNGNAGTPAVANAPQTLWTGPQWEYQQAMGPPDPAQMSQCCAHMGSQGWELCAQIAINQIETQMGLNGILQQVPVGHVLMTFKRLKAQ